MLKCKNCNKKFTTTQSLNYHIKNKVCQKKTEFACIICDKFFFSKYTLKRHLDKKHTEIIDFLDTTQSHTNSTQNSDFPTQSHTKIIKKIDTEKKKKFKCENCNKLFTRKDSLVRHLKKFCKVIKEKNIEKNVNNINYNINITNNITNNLQINSFGKEDTSEITDDEMCNILDNAYKSVILLLKKIHIDNKLNRNIYLPNIKDTFMYKINEKNEWELDYSSKIIGMMENDKINLIRNFIKVNKHLFNNKDKLNHICKVINNYSNGNNKKLANDIKLMLINNKDILKQNYENTTK